MCVCVCVYTSQFMYNKLYIYFFICIQLYLLFSCVCMCVCAFEEWQKATVDKQYVTLPDPTWERTNSGSLFRSMTSSMLDKSNFISTYWYLGVQLGGRAIQRGQLLCYKYHCLCFFGIVWRFRILTWEGSFSLWHHPCRVSWIPRVCLYCFSFSNYTFSIQRLFLSWTVWSKHTRGSYSGRLALGSSLEFWELNRNEHFGSIYF